MGRVKVFCMERALKTRYRTDRVFRTSRKRGGLGEWRFDDVRSQRSAAVRAAAASVLEAPVLEQEKQIVETAGWVVVVFDNDVNTYEEVMKILMIATGCTAEEAYMEAWEIDHLGKSVVHYAGEKECREAADVIAKIGIKVLVSEE
jgi:hypothetical protein